MKISVKTKYAVSGLLTGAANGFFGAGGGMVLIPLLTGWAKLDEKKAYATSICAILPLCVISAGVYYLNGSVDLLSALPYLIGGLAGGFLGGKLFKSMPATILRKAFGALIIYAGIRSLL